MLDGRAKRLVQALPHDFEAAIIGTETSRFYLLDFDAGDAGTLLLLPDRMLYLIDSRYHEVAQKTVQNADVLLERDTPTQLAEALRQAGATWVLLENRISIAAWKHWQNTIPNVEFDISNTLSKALGTLRMVKDDEELARMRTAQQITDACFAHILPFIREGVREVELALEMEHFMQLNGAGKPAFDTISVGGPNTSLPHGVPGDYRLQKGDLVTMDFGAKYKGYCSDMTRTVALGEPGEEKRRLYQTVLNAHLAGLAAAKAGKTGAEVDAVARQMIDDAGYKGCFGHGLGHGVGIEIHEEPRFSPRCHDVVRAGMMMTVEPGIYLPGRFGCRIEDMVRITDDGCEPLPKSPKELMVL